MANPIQLVDFNTMTIEIWQALLVSIRFIPSILTSPVSLEHGEATLARNLVAVRSNLR
jgi:hypothetical protein